MLAEVVERDVFVPSPGPGIGVGASSYYTTADGGELVSIHGLMTRSDTTDVAYVRRSEDNGATWSEPVESPTQFDHPDGTGRGSERGGYVDPMTGKYLSVWNQGVLPSDDPFEGMRQWTLHYSVSDNGGRTALEEGQVVHEGAGYDAVHHLPGVTVGKNCVMLGDLGQRPLTRSDGVILVPVQTTPIGDDGEYFNPGSGYTYTDCMLLMGTWRSDGSISWTTSQRIVGDPSLTTRGLIEPTIAELDDGSIVMVMRGSNDRQTELPAHKWVSRSTDGGSTWTKAVPWTYTDGEKFHSPSACSQLVPYSDGRLFWVGNICDENARGNSPRYPIVIGQVDLGTGLLRKRSVTVLDDRQDSESEHLTLSNFFVREDRESLQLLLHMTRLFANDQREAGVIDWTSDAMVYRIALS